VNPIAFLLGAMTMVFWYETGLPVWLGWLACAAIGFLLGDAERRHEKGPGDRSSGPPDTQR
jgi:hypothetical protein